MSSNIEKNITYIVGKLYHHVIRSSQDEKPKERNIILYVGKLYGHMIDAIKEYEKKEKEKLRIGLFYDSRQKLDEYTESTLDRIDLKLSCDAGSDEMIQNTLMPYQDEILALTSRAEDQIPLLKTLIPHIPYINGPTEKSLRWAAEKISCRQRLKVFDPNITPPFTLVTDLSKQNVKDIEDAVGYPLMVKPSGLAASRLVSVCFHREELEEVLKKVFKKIETAYKEGHGRGNPEILVERYMEGEMYSIDAYVSPDGKTYFCPPVHIKTGKSIGFDDFFGYQQITPTLLNEANINMAKSVAREAIKALALRSTTAHVELMKTEEGWKIIEVGPRVGGFRHMMYEFSYGINHTMNDVLIRISKKPQIPKKIKGYTVAMKFFAKKEGKLSKLTGIKKAQELKSFKRLYVNKKIGDLCDFAKHGGSSVFNIIMFNKERSDLLADIRRLEQTIEIEVE
ncbi:MAG: ATP-grasp domain-containing protein [Candidatus Magasanikbacteria bacterium]|nr:ATP-grasp domain-containing protein [Candidatus Magasanikbacteria bacterium]